MARITGALILTVAALGAAATPAEAQFPGHNGRVALAWLDSDQGAHEEAAWEIVSVRWRTGASTAGPVASCTMVEGCPSEYSTPAYSPDGTRIVYTETALNGTGTPTVADSQLTIANADGSHATRITRAEQDSYDASFLPSGQGLLFVRSHSRASDDGVDPEGQIVTSDLTGTKVTRLGNLRGSDPRLSFDGKHLLFTHRGAIWIAGPGGGHPHRLIAHASQGDLAPDGRSVLYVSGAPLSGAHHLFVARVDGTHSHPITGALANQRPGPIAKVDQAAFSPDGTQIAYATTDPVEGNPEIMRVPVSGGRIRQLWYAAGLDAGGINVGIAWQAK